MKQEQQINVGVLLKDCPRGTKLYSPAYGEVELLKETIDMPIMVADKYGNKFSFNFYGGISLHGECLLFPSKEVRDWGCFNVLYVTGIGNEEAQSILKNKGGIYIGENIDSVDDVAYIDKLDHKIKVVCYADYKKTYILSTGTELKLEEEPKFKEGDVVNDGNDTRQVCYKKDDNTEFFYITPERANAPKRLYRLATPKEIDKWNKVTLEPKHLHYSKSKRKIIHWFLPFDKVVVRDERDNTGWIASIFSHYWANKTRFVISSGRSFEQCLPYNEKTAKLIGTTDDYEEE